MKPERILVLIASGLVLFWFLWFQWQLVLLSFAGLLLAILLHAAASWVGRHTPIKGAVLSYLATLVLIAGAMFLIAFFLGPRFITQISKVAAALPQSIAKVKDYLQHTAWGASILTLLHQSMGSRTGAMLTRATNAIVSGIVDFVVVVVIGFFGALNPRGYREGLLSIFPDSQRARARELSRTVVDTLRSWLLGQLIPMAALGIASMISLWILGVHLAFTIGLLTGFMVFVPYIGTVLSGVAAVLLGLQRSPTTAMYVLILYCIFHLIEGYLLTPLVQKRAVRLPPVLTILAQFCLWSFAGLLGVAVAAPLTAVGLAVIKSFYPRMKRI